MSHLSTVYSLLTSKQISSLTCITTWILELEISSHPSLNLDFLLSVWINLDCLTTLISNWIVSTSVFIYLKNSLMKILTLGFDGDNVVPYFLADYMNDWSIQVSEEDCSIVTLICVTWLMANGHPVWLYWTRSERLKFTRCNFDEAEVITTSL